MSTQVWPLWEVFIRSKQGLNHKHVGSLRAADATMALENARDVYTRRSEGISIWVVESNYVHANDPSDADEFFEDPFTSCQGAAIQHAFGGDHGRTFIVGFVGFVIQRKWKIRHGNFCWVQHEPIIAVVDKLFVDSAFGTVAHNSDVFGELVVFCFPHAVRGAISECCSFCFTFSVLGFE